MPFVKATPAGLKPPRVPTISVAVNQLNGGTRRVYLNLNFLFTDKYFKGAQPGDRFDVQVGVGEDDGFLAIRRDPKGNVESRAFGARGVVSLAVDAWATLEPREWSREACEIISCGGDTGGVVIKMPWAA